MNFANIEHPRHRLHEGIFVTSVEELNDTHLELPCTPNLPYDIVVSCLSSFYTVERLFGDWIDFDNLGYGLYQQTTFPGFFLAIKSFLAQGRTVYIIVPQRAPAVSEFVHYNLHYIEIPEFYGIYNRIFSSYYKNFITNKKPTKKFTMINKRLRPSRLYSFAKCVELEILDKGIISLLSHGDGNMTHFDSAKFNNFIDILDNHSLETKSISENTLQQVKNLVPYSNNPLTEITDNFMATGGWLPDEELFSNSFVDVIHETHDGLPTGSQIFTEKTMRSIYLGKPFLLIGSAGSLQELHKLGFKTFSDFWDESYDFHPNLFDRQDLIFEQLIKLCNTSDKELQEIISKMQPVLKHNQARLTQLSIELDNKVARIDQYINTRRETLRADWH